MTLTIGVLNLMPDKDTAWQQIKQWTALSKPTLIPLKLKTHTPKNPPESYGLYWNWDTPDYDHLIVTGAPIEHLLYGQVKYWREFQQIAQSRRYRPTTWLCWAAMAALHCNFSAPKGVHGKISGMHAYETKGSNALELPDFFQMPVSRCASIDLSSYGGVEIVAGDRKTGTSIAHTRHNLFLLNHPEYFSTTLRDEYERDGGPAPYHYDLKDPDTAWQHPMRQMISKWLQISSKESSNR